MRLERGEGGKVGIYVLLAVALLVPATFLAPIIVLGEETIYYRLERLWASASIGALSLDWSPDGKYIVVGTEEGFLKIYDAEGGKNFWELKTGGQVHVVDWSPDGRYIAATNWYGGKVFVVDAETHKVVWNRKLDSYACGVAWDSGGEYLAVGTEHYLYLFTRNGELIWRSEKQPGINIWFITWSYREDKIAFNGGEEGRSVVVYSKDGVKLWEYGIEGYVTTIDWSPNGQYLAVGGVCYSPAGSSYGCIYVFDKNGNLLWRKYMGKAVFNVAWSPSEDYLAVSGFFGTALLTRTGKQLRMYNDIKSAGSQYPHGNLEWSEYMYLVVGASVGGDKIFVLDEKGVIIAYSERLGRTEHSVPILRVAWSPDQTRIAAVGGDFGTLYVWRLTGIEYSTIAKPLSTAPLHETDTETHNIVVVRIIATILLIVFTIAITVIRR